MARKLMDILLGRSEAEADAQDPEKVKANLEQTLPDFQIALEEGSRANQAQRAGFSKATELLRTIPPSKFKPIPTE